MPEIDPSQELRVYVEFLKIPEAQCPPNYYTLLAVPGTVRDTASFDKAAKRRSEELRRGLPVELHPAGRRILKRIAKARICLLDVDARAAYDASIGLKTRTDAEAKIKSPTKSTKGAHHSLPTSSQGPPASTQRSNPPSQKPSTINVPPEMDEFDDLLSGIPDVEPASTLPPLSPAIKPKPHIARPTKSSKSSSKAYAVFGGVLVLGVIVTTILLLPSGDSGSQATIPKLPLAERINVETAEAEYAVGDGVLTVSSTLLPYCDSPRLTDTGRDNFYAAIAGA